MCVQQVSGLCYSVGCLAGLWLVGWLTGLTVAYRKKKGVETPAM